MAGYVLSPAGIGAALVPQDPTGYFYPSGFYSSRFLAECALV